jgi:hypothetical protein
MDVSLDCLGRTSSSVLEGEGLKLLSPRLVGERKPQLGTLDWFHYADLMRQ